MKKEFTLEFNVEQQLFHHNFGLQPYNSFGWVTVMEKCTDNEFGLLLNLLEPLSNKKMTLQEVIKVADILIDIKQNTFKIN